MYHHISTGLYINVDSVAVYISSHGGTTKNGSFFADFVVAIINKLIMQLQIFYARSQNCEKLLLASSCLSVHPPVRTEQLNSASTTQIFMKFDICEYVENLSRKFKFHYNMTHLRVLYMKTNKHF